MAASYPPCRPTETVLYRIVAEHLDDFLSHVTERYASRSPGQPALPTVQGSLPAAAAAPGNR